jgi:metal-responsive CopG/Arc/MetJ family transcriptional regulator
MPGRRRTKELGVSLGVRLPAKLLAELDAHVTALNEAAAHDLAADPIGRTEVIRRAIADYLERRNAASPTFAKITARAAQIRAEQLAADGEEDITMAAVQAVAESLGDP